MSHEDAVAALQTAAEQDAAEEQAGVAPPASPPEPTTAPPAPEGAPAENADEPVGQAAGEAGGEQPEEEFVPFNPDDLPPELLPGWKQLQAAYTPRLQEAAAIRKRVEELGGFDAVQQAAQLQQAFSDPSNWPSLYEELYQAMEQAGFEFEDPTAPVAPQFPGAPAADDFTDPELAPLMQQLQQLQNQQSQQQSLIEQFYAQQEFQRAAAEEELRQAQHLANLQRQVVGIRQSNPHYTDDDMRGIIELGAFYNDDLVTASQRYEQIRADALTRYFEKKSAGAPPSVAPVAGAGIDSSQEHEAETLRDAEAEAVEYIRRLQDAGDIDFT